jgi:FO synthase
VAQPSPSRIDPDVAAALRAAERDPASVTDAMAVAIAERADGAALGVLARIADDLRRDVTGDDVTYVVNRNLNFTNVCYTGCRFCAFAQRRRDADAFTLDLAQVADRAEDAWRLGATEVCMQGGIDPELPGTAYFDLARAVKQRVPEMHVHAFSPMEVVNGSLRTGLSLRDWLLAAKDAGVDSLPGTAAEILDDDVRWLLTKGKLPASAWVEVISTAHSVGLPTSSTMMYGHVDAPHHWVAHLRLLADVQRRSLDAPQRPDLPRGGGAARPDDAREPGGARAGAHPAPRVDRQHPDVLGQARHGRHPRHAGGRLQRRRRHPDGGDHLADGRFAVRVGDDRGAIARPGAGYRPAGA